MTSSSSYTDTSSYAISLALSAGLNVSKNPSVDVTIYLDDPQKTPTVKVPQLVTVGYVKPSGIQGQVFLDASSTGTNSSRQFWVFNSGSWYLVGPTLTLHPENYVAANVGSLPTKASSSAVVAAVDDTSFVTPVGLATLLSGRKADLLVPSVSALRLLATASANSVYLQSYYGDGHGGDGFLYVNPNDTTSVDNGGSIFVDALNRRWYRKDQLNFRATDFGAKPDDIYGVGANDNAPFLNNAFAWALAQNTGVVVNLEAYTYTCATPPVIGTPSSTATPNQANPFTVKGTSPQRMAGKPGAQIRLVPTSIGQYNAILRVDGTQQIAYLTLEYFSLTCTPITLTIPAQTVAANTFSMPGGDLAGFATGTPVTLSGGGGATGVTRSGIVIYYLINQAGTDQFSLALNPANAAANIQVPISSAFTGTTTVSAWGGAINGLLYDGTRLTSPRATQINITGADNSITMQAVADSANGEFGHFELCEGSYCKRFFYMPGTGETGQALRTTFINCSSNPRFADGEACMEIGGGIRGYGIDAFGFNCSVVPVGVDVGAAGGWRKPIYAFRDNGTNEATSFYGGRLENLTGIVDITQQSYEERILFKGTTFAALASYVNAPMVQAAHPTGSTPTASSVVLESCFIYMNGGTWQQSNLGMYFATTGSYSTGIYVLFDKCVLEHGGRKRLLQGINTSCIEFRDCSEKISNLSTNATYLIRRMSQRLGEPVSTPMQARIGRDNINSYPGLPNNLLTYPDFGGTYGAANVVLPSPWVHFGSTASLNRLDQPSDVRTPQARVLRINATSGVRQVISGATPTQGVPLFYQADAWVNFSNVTTDTIRIALENDTTGEIYDEVFLQSQPNRTHSAPINLTAVPSATTGVFRLAIENLSATNVTQLRVNWHMVSANVSAAYVLPDAGSTATWTSTWSSNFDSARINSRLSLPYKYDAFGSADASMPNPRSDLYLSATNEHLQYYAGTKDAAGGKWWTVKRVYASSAMPTTGSWTANDYVDNTAPTQLGTAGSQYVIKGWIRVTTGSGNVLNTDWLQDRALTGN